MSSGLGVDDDYRERLLVALASDLRLPFTQTLNSIELIDTDQLSTAHPNSMQKIAAISRSGIELIDSYLLAMQIVSSKTQIALEPVGVSVILEESAHRLQTYALQYETKLLVHISGRPKPVLAHRASMEALFFCLGSSLIRAQAAQHGGSRNSHQLVFGAHANKSEWITAGIFGSIEGITQDALRTARKLVGRARQPLPALAAESSAGVLLADLLSSLVYHPLKSATHGRKKGLATSFPVSKQLRLV